MVSRVAVGWVGPASCGLGPITAKLFGVSYIAALQKFCPSIIEAIFGKKASVFLQALVAYLSFVTRLACRAMESCRIKTESTYGLKNGGFLPFNLAGLAQGRLWVPPLRESMFF